MTAEADTSSTATSEDVASAKNEKVSQLNKTDSLIHELREEAKNYRLKHRATKSEFELYKNEVSEKLNVLETEKERLNSEISKLTSYESKIVQSELKTQAVLAGIKDVDLIKLIDVSDVKLSEDGTVNIDALMQAVTNLKEKKPFLFGEEKRSSTSSNANFGAKKEVVKFDALTADEKEYQERKSRFIRSNGKQF